MVTKKTTKARSAPRRAAAAPKKKGRRVSTLNRSVKKPARAVGVAVGAMIPYAGSIVEAVKTKSVKPVSSAIMSKDNAVQAAKGAAVGFLAGTAVGIVVDKAGLKKPVNKILKSVKSLTGGIL